MKPVQVKKGQASPQQTGEQQHGTRCLRGLAHGTGQHCENQQAGGNGEHHAALGDEQAQEEVLPGQRRLIVLPFPALQNFPAGPAAIQKEAGHSQPARPVSQGAKACQQQEQAHEEQMSFQRHAQRFPQAVVQIQRIGVVERFGGKFGIHRRECGTPSKLADVIDVQGQIAQIVHCQCAEGAVGVIEQPDKMPKADVEHEQEHQPLQSAQLPQRQDERQRRKRAARGPRRRNGAQQADQCRRPRQPPVEQADQQREQGAEQHVEQAEDDHGVTCGAISSASVVSIVMKVAGL